MSRWKGHFRYNIVIVIQYVSHSSRCLLTFTFQTSSLKPLGKLEPNLVGMLIG